MPTRLILIRHGQTDWNLAKRYCGWSDIDINKKGLRQALKVSKILADEKTDKIYSSDLKRAAHTAQVAFPEKKVNKLKGLREINFGIFEGRYYKDIMSRWPKVYQKWVSDPINTKIPKGESYRKFSARIKKTIKKVIAVNRGKTVAVITHAGPIRFIISDCLKLKVKDIWQIRQDNGAISIIEYGKKIKVLAQNKTEY